MKCPYCKKDGVKPPKKNTVRPHGHCPHCDRHPRATVVTIDGVQTVVKYSAEGKARFDRDSVKSKVYQIRLSKQDEADLENKTKVIRLGVGRSGKTLVID